MATSWSEDLKFTLTTQGHHTLVPLRDCLGKRWKQKLTTESSKVVAYNPIYFVWNLYFAAWLQLCLRTHWTCRYRVICMFATNVFSFASQREATPSVHEHCVQRYCTSECDATITRSRFTCCKISQCQHTPHISYTHGGGIWRIFCDFKVWYIYMLSKCDICFRPCCAVCHILAYWVAL